MVADVYNDDGASFEVRVTSRHVLRWEKLFPGRSFNDVQGTMRGTYELVYVAAKAKNQLPEDVALDVFCDSYDVVPKDESETATADPTQPAA